MKQETKDELIAIIEGHFAQYNPESVSEILKQVKAIECEPELCLFEKGEKLLFWHNSTAYPVYCRFNGMLGDKFKAENDYLHDNAQRITRWVNCNGETPKLPEKFKNINALLRGGTIVCFRFKDPIEWSWHGFTSDIIGYQIID